MVNAVQPRALFVIALDDVPRRLGDVGAGEHLFLGRGVKLPPHPALQVHGGKFPLLHRIMDAHEKAHLLFLIRDREPVFDHRDAGPDQHTLELRHIAEEFLDLIL